MWSLLSSLDGSNHFLWSGGVILLLSVMAFWLYHYLFFYLKSFQQLVFIGLYYVFYGVASLVQMVLWSCNGVQNHKLLTENGDNYETCVQVMDILWRNKISSMNFPRAMDFIGLHQHFTHPSLVLSPRVTLYCVSKTHAYLVDVPEEIDIHSSKTSPFMYMAQFEHATRFYCIPLCHFHRVAQEVGDPKVPVIIISSSGRCGSTLIIQMLENLPGTRCLSEPDVTTNICLMDRARQLPPNKIRQMLQSTTRILCKEFLGDRRIVIKTRFNCSTELPLMNELFPEFKHLYLYRNMGHVLKSYHQFLHRDLAMTIASRIMNSYVINTFVPQLRGAFIYFVAGDESKERLSDLIRRVGFSGFVAACVGSCIVEFQKLINNGEMTVPTLHYDELMRCPLEVTSRLFQVLDLPSDYVQISLSAMQHDTQEGTILSNLAHNYNKKMTGTDVKESNCVLSMLGLPDMTQKLMLANPIEYNG